MKDYDARLKMLEYHFSLIVPMINWKEYPFYYMITKYALSKEQVEGMILTCEALQQQYIEEKEQGLVNYTALLKKFTSVLPSHCEQVEMIQALKGQGYYSDLMKEFLIIMNKKTP